jgi:hypothetical protein
MIAGHSRMLLVMSVILIIARSFSFLAGPAADGYNRRLLIGTRPGFVHVYLLTIYSCFIPGYVDQAIILIERAQTPCLSIYTWFRSTLIQLLIIHKENRPEHCVCS